MNVTHKIIIDFAKKQYIEVEITKNSNTVLEIYMLNQGTPLLNEEIRFVTLKAMTLDGKEVYTEIEFNDGKAVYEVSEVICNTPGKTTCVIQAVDEMLDTMESFEFYITSRSGLFDENDFVREDDVTAMRSYVLRSERAAEISEKSVIQLEEMNDSMQSGIGHVELLGEKLTECVEKIEDDLEKGRYIGAQGIQGPKGEKGIQGLKGEKGDKGEKGSQGESGVSISPSGFFNLSVDEEGNLYVNCINEDEIQQFELTEEGELYVLLDEKVYLGNIKGPKGDPIDKFIAVFEETYYDDVYEAYIQGKSIYCKYTYEGCVEVEVPLAGVWKNEDDLEFIFKDEYDGECIWLCLANDCWWQEMCNYVKDNDYATDKMAGIVKVKKSGGIMKDSDNALILDSPNEEELKSKKTINAPLKPQMIDKIVKYGLTDNQLDWTDEEKKSARDLLGITNDTNYGQLELISSVEITEEITALSISEDMNGEPFELRKAVMFYYYPKYEGSTGIPSYCFGELNGKTIGDYHARSNAYTQAFLMVSKNNVISGLWSIEQDLKNKIRAEKVLRDNNYDNKPDLFSGFGGNNMREWNVLNDEIGTITSIGFTGGLAFEGCKFILYGVRA